MQMNTQRVLIVQDASKELCSIFVKHILRGSSLRRGDRIRLLGIIQAFREKNGCASLLKNKTKLHSSSTILKHREDIAEETRKTAERYSKCTDYHEIRKIAATLQIEFEIVVEAGLLKEVAVEYAKSFQATHVILHRQVKKDTKYFIENLSCGISRMKIDNSIEILRPPHADHEVGLVSTPSTETRKEWRNAFIDSTCTICMNKRPSNGLKKIFTYAELQLATNGFCAQNLMHDHGKNVYFGLLNDQRKIMIRENPSATIKDEDFKREIKILEGVQHENVAFLVGSCLEGPHMYLVYEYVCDGSLNKHLSNKSENLTWDRRLNIAYGAAKGLEYLHGEGIYGSMRPSNILITHDDQPLISYFGFSVNRYEALGQTSESTVLRTFEYLAPGYEETGVDLSKADVYSFGVVLLELITGRKTKEHTYGQSFVRWARPLLRQKKYMELIDPSLQDSVDVYQLYWLVRVADKCLSWDPRKRYSMWKVVIDLSRIIKRRGVEDFSPTESEL